MRPTPAEFSKDEGLPVDFHNKANNLHFTPKDIAECYGKRTFGGLARNFSKLKFYFNHNHTWLTKDDIRSVMRNSEIDTKVSGIFANATTKSTNPKTEEDEINKEVTNVFENEIRKSKSKLADQLMHINYGKLSKYILRELSWGVNPTSEILEGINSSKKEVNDFLSNIPEKDLVDLAEHAPKLWNTKDTVEQKMNILSALSKYPQNERADFVECGIKLFNGFHDDLSKIFDALLKLPKDKRDETIELLVKLKNLNIPSEDLPSILKVLAEFPTDKQSYVISNLPLRGGTTQEILEILENSKKHYEK